MRPASRRSRRRAWEATSRWWGGRYGWGWPLPIAPTQGVPRSRESRWTYGFHPGPLPPGAGHFLPPTLPREVRVPPLAEAFLALHHPPSLERVEDGRRRLAFDE